MTSASEIGTSAPMGEHPESLARVRLGDRRHDTPRANTRRRAAEDALLDAVLLPQDTETPNLGTGGQTILRRGLERIERQAGVGGTIAWTLDTDGDPRVLAACPGRYATRIQPNRDTYAALATLTDVFRLTDGDLPVNLMPLAMQGVALAAPVAGPGSTPSAILLVFSNHPGRALRPRTVAVVGEVARSLASSLSTHVALDRLGQLDSAVARLDRLAALGGLVSEIVHEIRNPLVSVKTFLQLLPERLGDRDFHEDFRLLVADEVGRLERMLGDLLQHARPQSEALIGTGARIADSIETTLQLLTYRCRERGVELETRIANDLPAAGLSEDALRQLLLNLLLNATEVTKTGGRVLLSADWSPHEINHLELLVEDEGPGIDPTTKSRLFDPFWTTRSDGAGGLGLAICKRIVEEAGGTIEARNNRRGGATFRVALKILS